MLSYAYVRFNCLNLKTALSWLSHLNLVLVAKLVAETVAKLGAKDLGTFFCRAGVIDVVVVAVFVNNNFLKSALAGTGAERTNEQNYDKTGGLRR